MPTARRPRSPATLPGHNAGVAPSNKGQRLPPEVLTRDEVQRLLKVPSATAPTGVRNRALIAVLYRCGLRVTEALSLETRDVDVQACSIRVRHGKGDKARTVGVDQGALSMLQLWLDKRSKLPLATRRIFVTLDGRPLDSSYVRGLLPRLARKAGIEKRVHAHGLRHTMAAELLSEGTALDVIQGQLGHSSLATTAVYLRGIRPERVIQTMREREWG